ncbi:MAG: extracellular solute-binding protein [Anaerolineae bacterium]|nr:extracellular solute-binding protein [Anaerolineae bacterium]
MTLIIRLLGPIQISRDDQSIQIRGYQSLALLAYLLITGKAHTRQHLVDLLFDHSDDPRANLRWILSELRRTIGPDYLLADRQEVAFNFESDYWLDVTAFEAGQLELYRGDFLEGLHLRDAFRFEDWAFFERERLRGRYQQALEQQLAVLEQQGADAAVVETAHRLLRLDNLREDWYRALIAAYARQGKREAALAQFEQCRHALQAELGITPGAETTALAQAVQQGQIGSSPAEVSSPQMQPGAAPLNRQAEGRLDYPTQRRSLSWTLLGVIGAISLVGGLVVAVSSFLDLNSLADVSRGPTVATETNFEAGTPYPLSDTGGEAATQDLAGTTVTIVGAVPDEVVKSFERSMQPFEDRTGINVIYSSAGESFETLIAASVKRGVPPDIADFPQPGYMADFARQGKLIDVRTFLSEDYLRRQYPHAFLELATVDGRMVGVWYEAGLKSLVWYPKPEFEAAGYKVPATWDELIALSDQMVADGRTPWCVGMEDGDASGWVGTDWVEDILLRIAPPETYDAWVRHELPFNSPEVRRAFEILAGIWFKEGYVYGGQANIATESPADSSLHLLENPPGCYLHRQGSWMPQLFFPKTVRYGQDYDFFYLPPIDPQFGHPVLGGGKIFAMFNDRPEVREVMRYLTTVEATKGFVEAGGFIAPHRNVPLEWYPSAADLRFAQIILSADTYRFDGSDLMPGPVGTGSFWRGMVDWVNGADLETVLQEIDQSWPQ